MEEPRGETDTIRQRSEENSDNIYRQELIRGTQVNEQDATGDAKLNTLNIDHETVKIKQ